MSKRWILVLLTLLFLWFVISRFTELQQLRDTLAQGQALWILAAFFAQALYFLVFSSSFQSAFAALGISTRTREILPLTLGSLFVNLVVPAGGVGGAALFAEDLSRRGKSAAGAAAGVLLQLIADFLAFTVLLVPGLVYLFFEHDLQIYEIIAAILLLAMTIELTVFLVIGMWHADWLARLFAWSQRTANWMFGHLRRSLALADDWAQKNSREFSQAAAAGARHPWLLAKTVALALLAHIVDLITLFLLFMAFNQPISIGVLVAGYAIGVLFWIVSITPQGIGIVEGMMALTFTSLGMPGAVATTVSLAYRGLTFWLPMALGFIAVQRLRTIDQVHRDLAVAWGPKFVAALVAIMGVINVLSAVTPSLVERVRAIEGVAPLIVRQGSHLAAAIAGFALLLLAGGLWRSKRNAWILTMIVLGLSAISHLTKGLDYEEAGLALVLMGVLWAMRSHFHARSDPPSVRNGLRIMVAALLFTLAYGSIGFFLLDRHYRVNFSLSAALRQTVVMFTQFYDPGLEPISGFGRFFAASIYIVGAITVGYALLMLVRPVLARKPADESEQEQACRIVEAYGRSSLARMALFPDKLYFFSSGGSLIAYVVIGRVALALGDPIGPQGDFPTILKEFSAFCAQNDWLPAYYQVLPDHIEGYHSAGFDLLCVGHEGIVNLHEFTLEGHAKKDLRSAYNRLTKLGYHSEYYPPPQSSERLSKLRQVSDEWLEHMHGSEKRFSLGWFTEDYIGSSPVLTVETPEGDIIAFANLVPEYQLNEATIDLMRHRPNVPPGTMDYLFVALIKWAQAQGYDTFNLGLSALSGIGLNQQDPLIEKAMHYVYEYVNQFYNFKGLHSFKEKFNPTWSPRYLVYPGVSSLPAVAMALARAGSGDGIKDYVKNK